MPFLTAVIAALGAFLFWYFFLRDSRDSGKDSRGTQRSAEEVGPLRPQGASSAASTVSLINDPISATATFLVALALTENRLDAETEMLIKNDISSIMGVTRVEELYAFAHGAAEQTNDPANLMIRFARIWIDLEKEQRQSVYDMASRVAYLHGDATELQKVCLRQLAGRLGLSGA